jgi:hypothetical protein
MYLNKSVLIFITFTTSILIYLGLQFFPGNSMIYIIFSSISFLYIYYSFFSKDIIFFNCFLSIYLFLGFTLKLFFVEFFLEGKFTEINHSNFIFDEKNYNEALIITSLALLGFISSFFVAKKIRLASFKPLDTSGFDFFYNRYKKSFLSLFFISVFLFYIVNFYFSIFQKGVISNEPKLLILFFKFSIILIIPSVIAILLFHELKNKYNLGYFYFVLICFESFFSNLSIMSRAMIFNMAGLLLGIFYSFKEKFFSKKIIMILVTFIFFFISLYIVNITREFIYKDNKIRIDNIVDIKRANSENFNEVKNLIIKRFVGIDSVIALTQVKNLNMETFFNSLNDEFDTNELSYRDKIFNEKFSDNQIIKNKNIYLIKTVGIIGFFYYSGSYIFVFVMSFIFGLIFSTFEKILRKIFEYNMVFVSVISQIIAYRIIHFGYMPINSLFFFLAIILNIVFFIFIYKLLNNIRYK